MTTADVPASSIARPAARSDPAYQAFLLLRTVFTVAPILFGLDKFANLLVRWPGYLAPWIDDIVPGTAGGRLAGRDHRQPAELPGFLRHRAA
jgi:hypothetical protein